MQGRARMKKKFLFMALGVSMLGIMYNGIVI